MLFSNISSDNDKPLYIQIEEEIIKLMAEGLLVEGSKLPSTRELSAVLKISRNSCVHAYELLEDKGYIRIAKGRGAFIAHSLAKKEEKWNIDWKNKISAYGKKAVELDIMKHEAVTKKQMISFKSIAPDEKLFNLEHIRRDFLNSLSLEGNRLYNYGYARGYKPLMDYLKLYMKNKGTDLADKEILITNGFTEGFDIALQAISSVGDTVLCENPTHNTAIKLMKLHELNIEGIDIQQGIIDTQQLKEKLEKNNIKFLYLTPSYHNPTGIVMSAEKRKEIYGLCKNFNVPIIEDGFNEELLYSSSHISSISALAGRDNSVIYIGSFSKILFPGIRIGWILADKHLIDVMESIKRSRNIHCSVIDQAFLQEYLRSGDYEIYLKKAKKYYRDKYKFVMQCAGKYLSNCKIYGEGGLHIFIELSNIDARYLLQRSMDKGVIFMPGDIFYVNGTGKNTLRLGFSRLETEDIEKGIRLLGECIQEALKVL